MNRVEYTDAYVNYVDPRGGDINRFVDEIALQYLSPHVPGDFLILLDQYTRSSYSQSRLIKVGDDHALDSVGLDWNFMNKQFWNEAWWEAFYAFVPCPDRVVPAALEKADRPQNNTRRATTIP